MKSFILPDSSIGFVYLGSQYIEGDDRLGEQISNIRETLQNQLEVKGLTTWKTYTTGVAARIYDTTEGIRGDFNKILIFTSLTITALLILFLRKVLMSFRVLITILISLGLSLGIFAIFNLIFFDGLVYWIVPLMLYAVLTALGLDFDVLFLGVFIDIFRKTNNKEEAIIDAVDQTMSNISVAGIIMAATFLSLIFTSSIHMQQLGLGLGIGILIDVFVSRIFIVPPAIVLTFKQTKRKRENQIEEEGEKD
jgi:RND superfamily putative drug exporter